jgi:O-antigen/teichoic acid export membrane protein
MGLPKYYTYSAMISGVCGLIFYLLLIKPFGAEGAAAAKLISIVVTVFYYIYISRKHLDIKAVDLMKIAYPTISIACIIGISFYFISDFISNVFYLILFSSIADIIFITFVWIWGIVNEEEKQKILEFLKLKAIIINLRKTNEYN